MIGFIVNTNFKKFLIKYFYPVVKLGPRIKRKTKKKKIGHSMTPSSNGLEMVFVEKKYKIALRQPPQ